MPKLKAFLFNDAKKYAPALEVKYVGGATPKLIVYDDDNAESVRVPLTDKDGAQIETLLRAHGVIAPVEAPPHDDDQKEALDIDEGAHTEL